MDDKMFEKIDNLDEALSDMLPANYSITMLGTGELKVSNVKKEICLIAVLPNCYCLKTTEIDWQKTTTYPGTITDGVFSYFVDSLDECLGEVERMISYQPIKEHNYHLPRTGNQKRDAIVEWMEDKLNSGEIINSIHPGNQWQAFLTPALIKVAPCANDGGGADHSGFYIYYQIEIRDDNVQMYLLCNKEKMPPASIYDVMMNKILPTISKNKASFNKFARLSMSSMKITSATTQNDIKAICDEGLAAIKAYEKTHDIFNQ